MTTPPPLLLELLADRTLNPKAIAVHITPCEDSLLIPLINDEAFLGLNKLFPCLIPACHSETLAAETLSALQEAEEALMPQSDEVCGVLRIGCMHYNTSAEIDRLFALLDDMPH